MYSESVEESINFISSRSHWIEAPATNIEPSSAYTTLPSMPQAIVVTSPFFEDTGISPVFISRKQPVPYVFLASPALKHVWPKSAACWSPAAPAIGIGPPKNTGFTSPYTQLDGIGFGSMLFGISSSLSISSSHFKVLILNIMVLEALE